MSQKGHQTPPDAPPEVAPDAAADGVHHAHHAHRARRRRRRRKAGLWSLLSVAVLAGACALFVLSYLGTPIIVPDGLRARIADRINASAGGLTVEVGEMAVIVEKGWTPRLTLRAVTLRGPDSRVLATLSELGGTVAMRPLLRGQVEPSVIRLSGLQVNLRRDDTGGVGVQLGGAIGSGGNAPEARDPSAMIALIDTALTRPAMASLTGVFADNMTLRYEDARAGRAWTIDGGKVEATREAGVLRMRGDFTVLGARAYASTLEMSFSSRIGSSAAQLGLNFSDLPAGDLAMQSPALSWLDALDAPISGALRARLDGNGRLGPLNASLSIGKGALRPTEGTKPIEFDSARSYFTYDPAEQTIAFEAVSIDSRWVSASAEGIAHLIGGENGWPDELQAQLSVTDITADPADLYDTPIDLDGATLDMRLRLEPFHLSIGQLSLSDQGSHVVLTGDLRGGEAGWDLALDGRVDTMQRDRLMDLWPEAAVPKTRTWVSQNVSQARLRNVQLAVRSSPKHRPDVFLGFDFDDLTTRFMKQMPPIQQAAGKARLLEGRFAIAADSGWIDAGQGGRIDISGTSFTVPKIGIPDAPAEVIVHTNSSITSALTLIDNEPFQFLTKLGRPVDLADGRAQVEARLAFPLKKKVQTEEIKFDVSGTLRNLQSDVLVPGRVLSADALTLAVNADGLKVSGDGLLGKAPFSGAYSAALGPDSDGSRVEGTVTLNQTFADEFGIGLPPGSLGGSAVGDVVVQLPKGEAGSFMLTSNLAGLGLSLPQLKWSLPRATRGTLDVRGRLGVPPQIDKLSLDAPGLQALGSVSLTSAGQLNRAMFSRVSVGGWLNAPVTLTGRGKGAAPGIEVTGGSIDLRKADLAGTGGGAGAGGPVSLALDTLVLSDGIALRDFRARLNTANGVDGTFTGRVNGGAAIRGQIVPQRGRSAFRITADDAGGVLGSAGLLKQARGGTMELLLTPAGAEGTYEGQLNGGNITLTDAPALAALLSSLSVVGLLEQMSEGGIHFTDVDARFGLGPDRLTLYSGSAVGSSMGISMDGYYYLGTKQMDMQGVVSPFYFVNAAGGIFTRAGEGLVGVNYTLTGPAAAPKVGVNPLSLLTPGMFREIFRRQPPERPSGALNGVPSATSSNVTATQEAPPPVPAPQPRKPVDRGNRNRP
ncbi:AsmA-like C-terminal region-containing protein [Roseovarius arcticus]|uniref:YhdP family protein n=1 Tax=Roseovarius arcticus TaxID=2547404 RepID=UPI00111005BA|nr:AsmA-like C-terminal region-containing protein [Roseovarius arcticus]